MAGFSVCISQRDEVYTGYPDWGIDMKKLWDQNVAVDHEAVRRRFIRQDFVTYTVRDIPIRSLPGFTFPG